MFGRSLCPGGGEITEATSAAGPLCAKQDMRRVFSMKKVNSRSREKIVSLEGVPLVSLDTASAFCICKKALPLNGVPW